MSIEATPETITSRILAKSDAALKKEIEDAAETFRDMITLVGNAYHCDDIKAECGIGSEVALNPHRLFDRLASIAFERQAPRRRAAAVKEFMAKVAELEKMTQREVE